MIRALRLLLLIACLSLAAASGGAEVPRVDPQGLHGKVMCGYQGWFNAAGDGAGRGQVHWTRGPGPPAPGNAAFDLWPDLSEFGDDERFPTAFTLADGRPAEIFSSHRRETVVRHFRWMREYGIDGAFVQRFITDLRDPRALHHNDTVLGHCREGARLHGRTFALMYDLSGLGAGEVGGVLADWRRLRENSGLTEDPAYLHHRGKPLVAVWGIGFNDGRRYTLEECAALVRALRDDGCAVMLGLPTGWRTLDRDSVNDPALHDIARLADVISPWTVGRYRDPEEAARHGERDWQADLAWCADQGPDYLPVAFPGFSWHHLKGGPLDEIPRLEGRFLWSQFVAAREAGAVMIYLAMFDEVDEATAIFKCSNQTPADEGVRFLDYEGLPSDFYLRLSGEGGRLIRGELGETHDFPLMVRPPPALPDSYRELELAGWRVRVERVLDDHPRRGEALDLLQRKLVEIRGLLPRAAVERLSEVPLWLSRDAGPGACYHPSARWLAENGRVVEMARSIEFQNIDHFIDWEPTQPMMVLHELSHAWHHLVLEEGYGNREILDAYEAALASGRYERVRHANGRIQRHYAMTNAMEYFAESTEAYFGRNDFQPFDREELAEFDPAALELVERLWGLPQR